MVGWICSSLLLVIGLIATATNALTVILYLLRGKRGSAVPFVGGVAGALGLLILPVAGVSAWAWLPLILDYGSVPLVLFYIASRLRVPGWRRPR